MALIGSFIGQLVKNNTQTVSQCLTLEKKDVKFLSALIRDNTKRCWKPLAVVGVVGALSYGALKIRTEILDRQREAVIAPTQAEVENLCHVASSVDRYGAFNAGVWGDLDALADEFLEELAEEPELEDCLENDPAASEEVRWTSAEKELEIIELQINSRAAALDDKCDAGVKELQLKKCVVTQEDYHKEQYRKQRKRVRVGQLGNATRGLAAKIRTSFPTPDGSALQQKAMCLYAAKECRKMKIRENQIASIVPKAVALASTPTDSQVDMRRIVNIEPVQLKYNKMAWSGYKNKQSWLSRVVSVLSA